MTKHNGTFIKLTIAAVATFCVTATGTALAEQASHTVNLTVDGIATSQVSTAHTVDDLLTEAGITVDEGDILTPVGATELTDGVAVNLITAKDITLKVGRAKPVTTRVAALTVREGLSRAGVRTSTHDLVSPSLEATVADKSTIAVTQVAYLDRRVQAKVGFRTVVRKTPKLYKGERKVSKKGRVGTSMATFKDKLINGDRASTVRTAYAVTKAPVTRVVLRGTASKPSLSGVWKALAQCESGGNPNAVSSNGLYHGLFQFSVGTWHAVGGSGLPSKASTVEQLKRAKILQARSGWGQWPACSRTIGMR